MLRWTKWVAPVAAVMLMAGFQSAQLRADDTTPATPPALTGKATITVTVVDSDGKPVADAKVNLQLPRGKRKKGGDASATTQPAGAADAAAPAPAKAGPLETGVTGEDGTFALTNVPNGSFLVTARSKTSGAGQAKLTVADDKDQTLSITLKPRKQKAAAPAN